MLPAPTMVENCAVRELNDMSPLKKTAIKMVFVIIKKN